MNTWPCSRPRSGFVRPIFLSASSPPTPTISSPGLRPRRSPRVLWLRLGQFLLSWCCTPARVSHSSLLSESTKRHAFVVRSPSCCTLSSPSFLSSIATSYDFSSRVFSTNFFFLFCLIIAFIIASKLCFICC